MFQFISKIISRLASLINVKLVNYLVEIKELEIKQFINYHKMQKYIIIFEIILKSMNFRFVLI